MSNDLIKEKAKEAFSNALAVGKKYAVELAESEEFFKPIVMAMAIKDLRDALSAEAMDAVKQLAGTSLGFLSDRPADNQYPVDVIRECVIEAMIRGVGVVGNQFNIIAGRFYMARNGWEAKLRKAGCTQIVPTVGRPEDTREGTPNQRGFAKYTATFGAQATCVKNGQRFTVSACLSDGIDGRIEASAFGKDLSDCLPGMKGKVEARILKKLYCLACDAIETDEDAEPANVIVVEEPAATITEQPRDIAADNAHDAAILEASHRKGVLDRLQKILKAAPDKLALIENVFHAILDAKDDKQLKEAGEALAAQKGEFSQQVLSLIRPVYESRLAEMKGGAGT
jgi:hypothetical protein